MALLAEELVQEWLNRQGYFTIRGVRMGVQEIDLLAIRVRQRGRVECRHVEVQISHNPVSYICGLPSAMQKTTGMKAFSAKRRSSRHMRASVKAWIEKKFDSPLKVGARKALCDRAWSKELVVNKVRFDDELKHLKACGVTIVPFESVMADLRAAPPLGFGAGAVDFLKLVQLAPHRHE